jgi:hypothetical protein
VRPFPTSDRIDNRAVWFLTFTRSRVRRLTPAVPTQAPFGPANRPAKVEPRPSPELQRVSAACWRTLAP